MTDTTRQEGNGERIAAAPFAAWLNARVARYQAQGVWMGVATSHSAAIRVVAEECGWMGEGGVRVLWRYRHQVRASSTAGHKGDIPTETFPRHVVEDAIWNAGALFSEVYPELAAAEEPRELQPNRWCPGCEDVVTPLDATGDCPWCDLSLIVHEDRRAA